MQTTALERPDTTIGTATHRVGGRPGHVRYKVVAFAVGLAGITYLDRICMGEIVKSASFNQELNLFGSVADEGLPRGGKLGFDPPRVRHLLHREPFSACGYR